jgi:TonB family protein
MILAALALFLHPSVHAPAVRPAVATVAPRRVFQADDQRRSHRTIPNGLTTGVKLTIGTNGRIENCVVVATSGWPKLDSALCHMLNRAGFQPARDSTGAAGIYSPPGRIQTRPGTYTIDMRWEPPRF